MEARSGPRLMGGAPEGRALDHPSGSLDWQGEPGKRSPEWRSGLTQGAEGSPVGTRWIDVKGEDCTPQTPEPVLLPKQHKLSLCGTTAEAPCYNY